MSKSVSVSKLAEKFNQLATKNDDSPKKSEPENSSLPLDDSKKSLSTSMLSSSSTNFKAEGEATIQLFVNHIPNSWTETGLAHLFENEFGKVVKLELRNSHSQSQSKPELFVPASSLAAYPTPSSPSPASSLASCFLTFASNESAIRAQKEWHNTKVLASVDEDDEKKEEEENNGTTATTAEIKHPLQIKMVDTTTERNKRKLFIGMIPHILNENALRALFKPAGSIEECTILRDSAGASRGCAFITFVSRKSAEKAIALFNDRRVDDLDSAAKPLNVKFADVYRTKKERVTQIQQQMQLQMQLQMSRTKPQGFGFLRSQSMDLPWSKQPDEVILDSKQQQFARTNSLSVEQEAYLTGLYSAASLNSLASKQVVGPSDSNLFIYHLPAEFTDMDLAQWFSAFGIVLSAKVFIDKNTLLSKCFGFVSYDNAKSATDAIASMNGFIIRNKKLKVQLKSNHHSVLQ